LSIVNNGENRNEFHIFHPNISTNDTTHVNIEKLVRYAVAADNFDIVKDVLSSLTTFVISEQRNRQRTIMYIVVETCRKAKKTSMIVPLLRLLPPHVLSDILQNHHIRFDIFVLL